MLMNSLLYFFWHAKLHKISPNRVGQWKRISKHNKVKTKWLSFYRLQSEFHFLVYTLLHFKYNIAEVSYKGPIGSNGLDLTH